MTTKRAGFSMTELIVVIIIVSVLFALGSLLLRDQPVRINSGRTQSLNNLKQVALACHGVHDVYKKFPPAWGAFANGPAGNASLHYHMLPFIEQDNLYKAYDSAAAVHPYQSPTDLSDYDGKGVQNFAANLRVFSTLGQKSDYYANINFGNPNDPASWDSGAGEADLRHTFTDGTSNTIMFATRYANNTSVGIIQGAPNCSAHSGRPYHDNGAFFGGVAAMRTAHADTGRSPTFQLAPDPKTVDCARSAFAHSYNVAIIQLGMGDASVRTVSPSISSETWNRAMQPNDGKELGGDWEPD